MKILDTWTDGKNQRHTDATSPVVRNRYVTFQGKVRDKVHTVKINHPGAWDDFVNNVRRVKLKDDIYMPPGELNPINID